MRFILGFIFFGLLFYGLHLYLPGVFDTLVLWAAGFFDFITGLFNKVSNVAQHGTGTSKVQ